MARSTLSQTTSSVGSGQSASISSSAALTPRPAASKRILCYGDSLTAGFCNGGTQFEPYGNYLADILQFLGIPCEAQVCGLCGFEATEMEESALLPATQPDSTGRVGQGLGHILDCGEASPDLVIIMAGTNDMVKNKDLAKAFRSVRRLHDICHARGVQTVALAPPFYDKRKTTIFTKLLSNWARHHKDIVTFLDPEELVPRSPSTSLWEADALHLSKAGYRALGYALAHRLRPHLQSEPGQKAAALPVTPPPRSAQSPVTTAFFPSPPATPRSVPRRMTLSPSPRKAVVRMSSSVALGKKSTMVSVQLMSTLQMRPMVAEAIRVQ